MSVPRGDQCSDDDEETLDRSAPPPAWPWELRPGQARHKPKNAQTLLTVPTASPSALLDVGTDQCSDDGDAIDRSEPPAHWPWEQASARSRLQSRHAPILDRPPRPDQCSDDEKDEVLDRYPAPDLWPWQQGPRVRATVKPPGRKPKRPPTRVDDSSDDEGLPDSSRYHKIEGMGLWKKPGSNRASDEEGGAPETAAAS
mmetsp:Transcript_17023/g.45950  ORF Transcript_17023/g.45950 Transcript_17023/m.45950 type:complete len:199 (+) Transcript_17023:97-693(+)|eukprot:CAMPEP_0185172100 /NCGR_PEP_ID=MMETSP1139-20130426/21041_1 /TAXON_ID=298111 /ORGANISM="Pavlova sp., Strain CCMP459" /LENGTH=198 /DNA_ID=CAMNT_0027737727 /DNA_START=53 /DNA_END=649 /DNA_ORIENTATION=+